MFLHAATLLSKGPGAGQRHDRTSAPSNMQWARVPLATRSAERGSGAFACLTARTQGERPTIGMGGNIEVRHYAASAPGPL